MLISALALADDRTSIEKQARLRLALEDLDLERSADVGQAILKAMPRISKSVLSMTPAELRKHVHGNRTRVG